MTTVDAEKKLEYAGSFAAPLFDNYPISVLLRYCFIGSYPTAA